MKYIPGLNFYVIMKKILNWFVSWGKDKVLHFVLSFVIAIISACVCKVCGGDKFSVLAAAWLVGFFAGVGKEVYDDCKYKGSDSADWAADIAGTTLGTLVSFILVC